LADLGTEVEEPLLVTVLLDPTRARVEEDGARVAEAEEDPP